MRWLHILSAVTILGGFIYARYVVAPALAAYPIGEASAISNRTVNQFRPVLYTAIVTILVSGLYNYLTKAELSTALSHGDRHQVSVRAAHFRNLRALHDTQRERRQSPAQTDLAGDLRRDRGADFGGPALDDAARYSMIAGYEALAHRRRMA